MQTTGGRDKEISLVPLRPQGCLEDTMSLPHPHSKDPAPEPRRVNPNQADGAGVQHPSYDDEDPPSLTLRRPGRGLHGKGWAVQVLSLLAWSWRPSPVYQGTLRPLKLRPPASDTRMCLTHSGACVRAAPGGARRQTARRRGESSGAASFALLGQLALLQPRVPLVSRHPEINLLLPVHPNPSLIQISAAI